MWYSIFFFLITNHDVKQSFRHLFHPYKYLLLISFFEGGHFSRFNFRYTLIAKNIFPLFSVRFVSSVLINIKMLIFIDSCLKYFVWSNSCLSFYYSTINKINTMLSELILMFYIHMNFGNMFNWCFILC